MLKRFPQLVGLQVDGAHADDALLARLAELPKLHFLRLDDMGASGEVSLTGWKAVATLHPEEFCLYMPHRFDAVVVAHLREMPELNEFRWWTTLPLVALVPDLLRAPRRRYLGLSNTLTDAGVRNLRTGKNLLQLHIQGNPAASEAEAARLAEALPRCQINANVRSFEPRLK